MLDEIITNESMYIIKRSAHDRGVGCLGHALGQSTDAVADLGGQEACPPVANFFYMLQCKKFTFKL